MPLLLPYKALIALSTPACFPMAACFPIAAPQNLHQVWEARVSFCLQQLPRSGKLALLHHAYPWLILQSYLSLSLSLSLSLALSLCTLGMAQLQAQVFPTVLSAAAEDRRI